MRFLLKESADMDFLSSKEKNVTTSTQSLICMAAEQGHMAIVSLLLQAR